MTVVQEVWAFWFYHQDKRESRKPGTQCAGAAGPCGDSVGFSLGLTLGEALFCPLPFPAVLWKLTSWVDDITQGSAGLWTSCHRPGWALAPAKPSSSLGEVTAAGVTPSPCGILRAAWECPQGTCVPWPITGIHFCQQETLDELKAAGLCLSEQRQMGGGGFCKYLAEVYAIPVMYKRKE